MWFELMPFHCSNLWIWNTFIFCCHSILSLSLQPVCVCVCVCVCACACAHAQINLRRYNMQSFSTKVGSCGYHIYHDNNWTNLVILSSFNWNKCHLKGIWSILLQDRIPARQDSCGHSWSYSLQTVVVCLLLFAGKWFCEGTVASIQYRVSSIPVRRLEIPIQITFSHTSKPIVEKMKLFVESQFVKMD